MTLGELRTQVLARLGDPAGAIWSVAEVDGLLHTACDAIAMQCELFWDWTYLENLPPSFSYTAAFERDYLPEAGFNTGRATFSSEFERRLCPDVDERDMVGPGVCTSPFEATEGFLAAIGGPNDIPATAELPKTVTALSRVTWDARTIDAVDPRPVSLADARYELTPGEVRAYTYQKDGVRTLRKIRVPAAMAAVVTVNGSWGGMRQVTDLSTDAVTGTWGLPRRIPGHHPIGTELFGLPRRPYLEGTNVRVEHFRTGRPLLVPQDVCELPDRYALYLRDYVQAVCLEHAGPGQDVALAQFYRARWTRHLARLTKRVTLVDHEHAAVMGGTDTPLTRRPPVARLPWQYAERVR